MMFSKKLRWQAGILKQKTWVGGATFNEDDLLPLTGNYDKIHNKNGQQIIIVEVLIQAKFPKIGFYTTYIDIEVFKNAPALKKLIP